MKTMKKRLAMFIFLLAAAAGILAITPATKASAASTYNKKLKLNTKYTKYDITGDGKADSIYITQKYKDYWYEGMLIYINEKVYDIPCPYGTDWFYEKAYCHLIRLKNGKKYLHVRTIGDDEDDGYQSLYRFTGTKMKNVLRLDKPMNKYTSHLNSDVTKVKDNKITVKYTAMLPRIAYTEFIMKYKNKDGKFALSSKVGDITGESYKKVKKTINWYTGKGCTKKKSSSLKKGTKAKPVQIYIKSSGFAIKIKTKSGKTGWVKGKNKMENSNLIFMGDGYAG